MFVNFKPAELKLKKEFDRIRAEFQAEPISIESNRTQTCLTQLDLFPDLSARNIKNMNEFCSIWL
jgi:hypothetical protein